MDEPNDLHHSKGVLQDYIITLYALRTLILYPGSSSEDRERIFELTKIRVEELKGAFESRRFLKDYYDFDISNVLLSEFEDFLGGRIDDLGKLDDKLIDAGKCLESMRYLN